MPTPPIVLQVSALDKAGGAEQVAWNLFSAYRDRGTHSWLAVGKKRTADPNVVLVLQNASKGLWEKFCHSLAALLNPIAGKVRGVLRFQAALRRLGKGSDLIAEWNGLENFHFPSSWKILECIPEKPAILHLHNLHGGYFDPRALTSLSKQLPVVLTLHDAWLLSGNCAHSFSCERWKSGCGNCPDISLYPGLKVDSTAQNWQRKKLIFEDSKLYVATPSQWLMNKVLDSILSTAILEAKVIPNGVDEKIFHPGNQRQARSILQLPMDNTIILFVANGIKKNVFKDYETLDRAMRILGGQTSQKIHFIALGEEGNDEQYGNVCLHHVPRTTDANVIVNYYQAADLYLHPTKADTFPTSILEAMACGLPVIASRVGGIPEQVDDGLTGVLVNPGDPHSLAREINLLLADSNRRYRMSEAAIQKFKSQFTLDNQVNRYLEWYQCILAKN